MFVLQPETNERAKPQPKPGGAAINYSDNQINGAHPKERLERVHGKEIADGEKDERAKRSRAAERYCPTASAQLACNHSSQRDAECACNRGQKTDREQRITEEKAAQAQEQRRKRR